MMKRSQIYLPVQQWRTLSALSHEVGQSVSELIRRALDRVYMRRASLDFETALGHIAGLWKGRRDIPDTGAYIRALRRDRRPAARGHA